MRWPFFLLVLAIVALAALPLADGRYVLQGKSPWDAGYMFNPQMYCDVVYDTAGEEDCTVSGNVRDAAIVRINIAGSASVHVSIVDMVGHIGLPEQRAVIDCTASCIKDIPYGPFTDGDWIMWVDTASPGNSVVTVSVEIRTQIGDRTV